jgi:hypothetical protein
VGRKVGIVIAVAAGGGVKASGVGSWDNGQIVARRGGTTNKSMPNTNNTSATSDQRLTCWRALDRIA